MSVPQFLVLQNDTIHHEGDQRSRDYPGHGYGAHTESVVKVYEMKDEIELTAWISRQDKYSKSYRVFACTPVEVKIDVKIAVKTR